MKQDQSSKTAEAAAAIRALHYLYESPHILADPYAIHLTNWKWRAILSNRFFPSILKSTGMRKIYAAVAGQILSRSRYTEDRLQDALKKGIRQYVILGAGMDSYALRHPELEEKLNIFEIDHPGTQSTKRNKVLKIANQISPNQFFIPVDFEKQNLTDALIASSFKLDEPAFFSWIATTYYLTRESIFNTLASIAKLSTSGSEVIFDYVIANTGLSDQSVSESDTTKKFVERRGEVYLSEFEHNELIEEVCKLGFELLDLVTPEDMHRLYFVDRKDRLKAGQWSAMVHFRCKGIS